MWVCLLLPCCFGFRFVVCFVVGLIFSFCSCIGRVGFAGVWDLFDCLLIVWLVLFIVFCFCGYFVFVGVVDLCWFGWLVGCFWGFNLVFLLLDFG